MFQVGRVSRLLTGEPSTLLLVDASRPTLDQGTSSKTTMSDKVG